MFRFYVFLIYNNFIFIKGKYLKNDNEKKKLVYLSFMVWENKSWMCLFLILVVFFIKGLCMKFLLILRLSVF